MLLYVSHLVLPAFACMPAPVAGMGNDLTWVSGRVPAPNRRPATVPPTDPMSFRLLSDHELQRLTDDALIAYMRDARDRRELDAARRALALLVFGYEANVKRRLRLKLPDHMVDDLAHDVLVRAISSAFEGRSVGEFRSWLHTIVDRSVADHYRRAQRRPKEVALTRRASR